MNGRVAVPPHACGKVVGTAEHLYALLHVLEVVSVFRRGTIFVAKHPVTKPNLKSILKSESHITKRMETLFQEAIDTAETIRVEA